MATPSDSPEADFKAALHLARSGTVSTMMKWALGFLVPGFVGVLGWAGAKLDTQRDLIEMRRSIDDLNTQQKLLVERVGATIPDFQRGLGGVQRDVVVATGAALAYETEARAKQKREAGEKLAQSYDGRVISMGTAAAAHDVISNVALPRVSR